MERTIETAVAYLDRQDPTDTGWAYRVTYTDGHQESGGADDLADAIVQCAALGDVVPTDIAAWTYREHDGGSYVWRG